MYSVLLLTTKVPGTKIFSQYSRVSQYLVTLEGKKSRALSMCNNDNGVIRIFNQELLEENPTN